MVREPGDSSYCTNEDKCSYGKGDCDGLNTDKQCQTGLLCSKNKGEEFGFEKIVDVCLCPEGKTWDGDSCESSSTDSGGSGEADSGSSTDTRTNCFDLFDEGDNPQEQGVVSTLSKGREKSEYDSCDGREVTYTLEGGTEVSGKASIFEYICEDGKSVKKKYGVEELGTGYCSDAYIGLPGAIVEPDGTITGPKAKSAKWISVTPSTSDESSGTEACTDTDPSEDITVAGIVTHTDSDGKTKRKKDSCISPSKVRQYKCEENKIEKIDTISCGPESRCVKTDNGSKCVALTSVSLIDELRTEIQILKEEICEKDSSYSFCEEPA